MRRAPVAAASAAEDPAHAVAQAAQQVVDVRRFLTTLPRIALPRFIPSHEYLSPLDEARMARFDLVCVAPTTPNLAARGSAPLT
jgi:hypothetical protein